MRPELPIEDLLNMLRSDDVDARRVAAVALEKRSDPAAVPALLVAVRDSDVRVRRPAASTLSYLLRDEKVAMSFGATVSEAFQAALGDTSPIVRRIAISALADVGDPSILPTLLVCWDDDDSSVHSAVVSAMRGFAEAPVRFFVKALSDHRPTYRADAAQILEWIGDRTAVPNLLIARGDEDRSVRRKVLHALVSLGEESSELIADLLADLGDPDPQTVVAAVKDLGLIGNPVAVPSLVSTLVGSHPLKVRFAAAEALGVIADPAAVPALVSALKDPEGLIRATAARALGDIGDPDALAPLGDLTSDEATFQRPGYLGQPGGSTRVSTAAGQASAKIKSAQALRAIRFSAYYPKEIVPNVWQAAHVYVFETGAAELVAADARELLGRQITDYRSEEETVRLTDAGETPIIRVIPRLDGFEFNPAYQLIDFREPWHRLAFRLRASDKYLFKASNGAISIMVNGAIVGDIPISIHVNAESATSPVDTSAETYKPYQSIFCSYSHRDATVAKRVERVCRVLGMSYLRDGVSLRSGENWSVELLAMIERADVFQLFWSKNAVDSGAVEKEWRHAYQLGREAERFIRPVYWAEPMPQPPTELAHLHFAFEPELRDMGQP